MGLFDKIKEPIFLKNGNEAERQLAELQELRKTAGGNLAEVIDAEIRQVEAGIYGENAVRYELENSHIPMFVLHDLYLEDEGLSAQIDYLIITRNLIFVVECKNLYGNIEINNKGDFIRSIAYGGKTRKEGIYSPITQNKRHLELIKQLRRKEQKNILLKSHFEKHFYDNYRSIVVLANPKTILNAKYAKKEIKDQVIKADQLAEYIRKSNASPNAGQIREKDMEELANFFFSKHRVQQMDYTAKFRELKEAATRLPVENVTENESIQQTIICPKCGSTMVKRKATKGANAGKEFYGCCKYPKCRSIINII